MQLQHAPNMHQDDLPFDSWHRLNERSHFDAANRPRTNIQMIHVSSSVSPLATQSACVYCNESTVACCDQCPPPSLRICNSCQARGRGCFWCQECEGQWGQTASSTIVALERRLVPVTGYISRQQRAYWNVYTRHCLPQVSIIGVAFGATAPLRAEPFLQPTLQPGSSLTSLDPIANSMNA